MSILEPPPFASWADLEREALACTKCPLAETRTQVVFGVGDPHADLMFVGEGPGEQEDLTGEPIVGRAGRLLTSLIEDIGLTRAQVYIANVVKCRPPGNRDPMPAEIESCRPYLEAQIGFIEPKVVVTLGNFATKLLLDTKDGITKLRGREFPFRDGAVLIPVFHPSAVLRNGGAALAQARRLRHRQARVGAGVGVVMMTLRATTHDALETHALGQRLGALLRAGDVVVLDGELGVGKTVLAKGIAVALGITEPVVSPTFTVVREYDAPTPLVHVDVYRLDHVQELHDLGFDDLVGEDAVTVVEWGDRVSAALPSDRLRVLLEPGEGDDDRVVSVDAAGITWGDRHDALAAALTGAGTDTGAG